MSARDDLAAAMGKLDAFDRAANGPGDPSYTRLQGFEYDARSAALLLVRKHGKHLLALLDAEPGNALLEATGRYVKSIGGEVVVAGPVECGQDYLSRPGNFFVIVRCTGRVPARPEASHE